MIRNGNITNYQELERHPSDHDGGSHEIELRGCSPVPLAHYLKALGIFRIISEQKDSNIRGYWNNNRFYISTKFTEEDLVNFFLFEYKPSPIISPWNGRSGFLEETEDSNRKGAEMKRLFSNSKALRFDVIKNTIEYMDDDIQEIKSLRVVRNERKKVEKELNELKIKKNKDDDDRDKENELNNKKNIISKKESSLKKDLLNIIRNKAPDNTLKWMDSTLSLKGDLDSKPEMLPLLGSGGVDGSQDFSVNFLERLVDLFDLETGKPKEKADIYLKNSLFQFTTNDLPSITVGQFNPIAVGGANAESGFESDSFLNPWDYILLLEGTLFFISSVTKKNSMERQYASAPFTVVQSVSGYGSASVKDRIDSRAEIWVPLWDKKTTYHEIQFIFSEGKASIGKRQSYDGIDFTRAIATLGVDRGLSEFIRYSLLKRNGKNYFAIPIGRFKVQRRPDSDILMEIDQWMGRFRYYSTKDESPASFKRAANNLDRSILDICKKEGPHIVQNLLVDLGKCERTMVNSFGWTKKSNLKPIPPLSSKWLEKSDDGSVEFRLAASLASIYGKYGDCFIPIRYNIEPVNRSIVDDSAKNVWWKEEGNKDFVPTKGDIFRVLNSIQERRMITASQKNVDSYPDHGKITADLGDISDFLEGRCNYNKLMELLWGMILLDWVSISKEKISLNRRAPEDSVLPGADYSVIKLCHHRWYGEETEDIPLDPQIHRKASRGEGGKAVEYAVRRLRGSGIVPAVDSFPVSSERSIRIATSLLFPIDQYNAKRIRDNVTRPEDNKKEE
jgi:CRISPR-associated protein Csx17